VNRKIKPAVRLSVIIIMAVLALPARSQGTVVTGIITDNRNVPIVGVRACQVNSTNCTVSDINGVFHLVLEADKGKNLNVTCPGFNPAEVSIDETTVFPVTISLMPLYLSEGEFANEDEYNPGSKVTTRSGLGFDLILSDFSEFSTLLGSYNTEAMDYFAVTGPEIGASFQRVYTGVAIGMGYSYKENYDTLVVDLNNTLFKLNLGYDIISTRRIRMTPLISLRWMKCRLRNYPGEKRVTLENYLREKETDLRFNQTIAVAGLNLEYLMYNGNAGISDYWSIGIFGGYAVKLNRKPWIWSDGNRITTDSAVRLNPITAGISLSYYTSSR